MIKVGAKRCASGISNCRAGCKSSGKHNGTRPIQTATPSEELEAIKGLLTAGRTRSQNGARLLSLTGGGVRGSITALMLHCVEKWSQTQIAEQFDYIIGSSTGGILGLCVGKGLSMKTCMLFYLQLKDEAFNGGKPYAAGPLEKWLKRIYGENATMNTIKKPKIMVTATKNDKKPMDLHLFRNYKSSSEILGFPSNTGDKLLWKVGLSTGAAPTFFPSFEGFLDRGLVSNNPTFDGITEILEVNAALKKKGREGEASDLSHVVCFGTGISPAVKLDDIEVRWPGSLLDFVGAGNAALKLAGTLTDQLTLTDGIVEKRARTACSMLKAKYFYFNPPMSRDIGLDKTENEPLIDVLFETLIYMIENKQQVLNMIQELKRT